PHANPKNGENELAKLLLATPEFWFVTLLLLAKAVFWRSELLLPQALLKAFAVDCCDAACAALPKFDALAKWFWSMTAWCVTAVLTCWVVTALLATCADANWFC